MLKVVPSVVGKVRTADKSSLVCIGLVVLFLGGAVAWTGLNLGSSPRVSHAVQPPAAPPPVRHPLAAVMMPGLVAALTTTTDAYSAPGGLAAPSISPTWHGSPLFLPVIAMRADDLEVRLPTRPNGSTTWIRRAAVRLYRSPYRIVVNLATRHLFLYRDGRLLLDAPAGIGTAADPTPTGQFFVAFFAAAPTPAWGPFVLVTSAHSNAISDWEESGDALVAIHGPLGDDTEIGTAGAQVSHGCIRLHDGDLAQLRVVPDGSPVDIIS